jgi:shikimate kinase
MRIFLIGFMGSGKTTLGRELAGVLGIRFLDMDQEIEQSQEMTINRIFSEKGEPVFREMESALLQRIILMDDLVVSTGGGIPAYRENMELINGNGISIYLEMDPQAIFNVLKDARDERPLIRGKSDTELMEYITATLSEREKYYKMASIIADANAISAEELAYQLRGY